MRAITDIPNQAVKATFKHTLNLQQQKDKYKTLKIPG